MRASLFKRVLVMALCVVMLIGLMPAISFRPVYAATTSQNNIVARADYLYGITWTAKSTVYGWNYNYTFSAGSTYRIPYGQPINSGGYIGYAVSVDDFVTAANTPGSVFYTSRSTYDSTSSVYYATDCSAFVSWCWGIDRKTTYSIPQVSTYIGMATASNAYSLQLGDCLNSNDVGHVVLVTDLVYSGSTLTSIEITEQTPPQLKRSYYTPSELGSKYGTYYGIYRYYGSVPSAPAGSSSGSSSSTSGKYYPACSAAATTFYGGMAEIGIDCSWELHQRIAAANGITDFSGTAEQNTTLLNLLIAGKLINPDYSGSDDSGSSSGGTVTSGSNGYERGYAGGMAGTGEYKAFGLDVSSWQGSSLNFNRIKNAGYDYVILRAGTTNGKDECFETYYTNAKAAGLDVGVYYYSYATSVSAVKADMEDFLSYIKGKTYEYPVYFDYEDASQQALSSSLSQQICLTAMDMLAAEGYLVGMYTGKYFSTQLPMDTICAKYEVWIAHYLAVGDGSYDGTGDYWKYGPTYSTQYGMYQFTDSVWINGYGPYDGDVCYKDYPSIVKTYGFNGYSAQVSDDSYFSKCTFYPSRCQIEVTEATSLYTEPRSASDAIEDAELGTVYKTTGMYCNNGGNMWYEVETSDGGKGYIYSGRVEYQGTLTDDITITGYDLPENHTPGDVFIVNGTIASTYNQLDKAAVYIYEGKTTSGTPVTGGSASVSGNKYTLASSIIDNATSFGDLTDGVYTYAISANYTNYYASSTKEATAVTGTKILVNHAFAVGDATAEETYFDKCTFYPSRCTFTTNRDTSIFSEPRTQKTGNTSVALEDAPNGTTYKSTGLYVNSGSNIFYQVETSDGQLGYIYSGYTDFGKKAYDDITLKNYDVPNAHVQGDYFLVTGTIAATYNVLGTAKVTIYSGFGTDGTVVTSASGTVSNNQYVLDGSAIDHGVDFGALPVGQYTYVITVTFSAYYAQEPQVLGTTSGTRTLKKAYFTVVEDSVDSSTCSHNNSETVLTAATCTVTGKSILSCSICGLTQTVTTDKTSHNYGSYTVTQAATCTEAGSKEKVCADCGKVYTKEIAATGHSYGSATCTEAKTCSVCGTTSGEPLGHSYSKGICTVCGVADPSYVKPDYLLVGYINGADYGCNNDSENLGIYKFENGSLTATFTENSYVFVKTSDNADWYMAQTYSEDTSVNLYSTTTGAMEKLYVPGNVEITFTLTENGDGSLTLSYVTQAPEVIEPVLTPKYPSLSFEGEVFYNVYFTVSDATSVVDLGLITFDSAVSNGTIDNAANVIAGYEYVEAKNEYKVRSAGIPAKKLGDTLYFRVYAKLTDGSYIYSGMYNYSAVAYAKDRLANSTNTNMKALCVAMVNYGAAAQINFNYKADSLMNSFLTAEQRALVKDFDSSMVKAVGSVDSAKAGNFVYNSAGFSKRYPSVNFEGAFSISYYFTASNAPANGMKLYYWDAYTYATVDKLTTENATGVIDMDLNTATIYKGTVEGIAAKEIDSTIYVAGVYEADGVSYCTGVLAYSLGAYCVDRIANGSANMQAFGSATAVYGYYAKVYFNIA